MVTIKFIIEVVWMKGKEAEENNISQSAMFNFL